MAKLPDKERNNLVRKTMESHMDEDFEMVDVFVNQAIKRLEFAYDDERLLNGKVEEFLEEMGQALKRDIRQSVELCRTQEADNCCIALGNSQMVASEVYENNSRKLERDIEMVFDKVQPVLEKLRAKVEQRDRSDSDIAHATKRCLQICLDEIVDEYKMSSKKMVNKLDDRLGDYYQEQGQDR